MIYLVVCVCRDPVREQDVVYPNWVKSLDSHGGTAFPKVIALMLHHPGVKTFGFPDPSDHREDQNPVPNASSAAPCLSPGTTDRQPSNHLLAPIPAEDHRMTKTVLGNNGRSG